MEFSVNVRILGDEKRFGFSVMGGVDEGFPPRIDEISPGINFRLKLPSHWFTEMVELLTNFWKILGCNPIMTKKEGFKGQCHFSDRDFLEFLL